MISSVDPPPMSSTATGVGDTGQGPGGAVVGQRGLLVAGDHLGVDTQPRVDAVGERVDVARVAGRRGRDEPHGVDTRGRSTIEAYSSQAAKTRASASSASRPVRSTSWPSRTIRSSRTRLSWVPAVRVDVGDEQPDGVRAAVDRGDPGHSSPAAARRGHARAGGPELAEPVEHLVAERVDPSALGERLRGQHVQALDPCRHAAGGDARRSRARGRLTRGTRGRRRGPCVGRGELAGRRRAARTSPSSARTPRACRSSRRPGGRSGRRSWGTACRPRAAARWPPRRGCRTGSGARPRGRSRGAAELGLDDGRRQRLGSTRSPDPASGSPSVGARIRSTGGGSLLLSTGGLPAATTLPHADCHHSGRVASVTEFGGDRVSV